MTRVAILNSRQSKTPVGNDSWVRVTLAAVEHAARSGWIVVSSYGLNTWGLVTWAAGQRRVRLALVAPEDITDEQRTDILSQFALCADMVEWITVPRDVGHSHAKNWWESRDAAIIQAADTLLPVSIRNGGQLAGHLGSRPSASIDELFRTPHDPAAHHLRFRIMPESISPELHSWDDGWLIHWTRACHGPWPGETEAAFYTAMTNSGDEYCRSGLHTLRRILQEGRIRASSWRIGSGVPVVAFTELTPIESISLMRWRQRWSRWSIEPYGIAVHRSLAGSLGMKPVQYVENSEWDSLTEDARPFSHVRGKNADIWPVECEWRLAGDLDLSTIPIDQIRVITRCRLDQDELTGLRGNQVICFEKST